MTQTRMDFGSEARLAELEKALMRALRAALDDVTAKVFAARAGIDEGDLSRAINGRGNKPWRQSWTMALLDCPEVTPDHRQAILALICAPAGMAPVPRQPESARDVAQAAIAELRAMGPRLAAVADELEARLAAALAREVRR